MAVTAKVLNKFFPIGTIYESTSSTSPAAILGGSWEQIKGRFLVAAGDNGASGNEALNLTAGATGGISTHTLTEAEMAQHNHAFGTASITNANFDVHTSGDGGMIRASTNSTVSIKAGVTNSATQTVYHTRSGTSYSNTDAITVAPTVTATVGSQGSGNSYATLPPYQAIYIWKRVS